MVRDLIDRFRNPAYIGRNRCYPCTVVNVALVGAGAALIGIISIPVAVVVACIGLTAVWLRGYVVPGTPRLTRRYLPERVLASFGKSPSRRDGFLGPNGGTIDTDEPADILATLGVLANANEPSLAASFEQAWSETVARLVEDDHATRVAAAEVLSVRAEQLELGPAEPSGVTLTLDGDWVGSWPSRTALVSDLASELTLAGDAWSDLDRTTRADLMARIRGVAATCPACGNETVVSDDTVESCCRSVDVVAVTCRGCSERLAEFEQSPRSFDPGA